MQALATELFRKCRTLQRNRLRDVTYFVDRIENLIHDFIRPAARQWYVCISVHMRSGNFIRFRMTRRKWNWYEANRNDWHCMHSAVFCDLWLLYKISRRWQKNSSLFLSAYGFWFLGHETELLYTSTYCITCILTRLWFNTEFGAIWRDLCFLMYGKYYEFYLMDIVLYWNL